jgi:periplasmic protein TonB
MISRAHPFLGWALVISIALHALLIAAPAWRGKPQSQPPLTVSLREPRVAPEAQLPAPELPRPLLPEKKPRRPAAAPSLQPVARPTVTLQRLSGQAARVAGEQMARELLYPAEAVERGLQGEALVLLFLDESGNAVAARLEESSGHALLDDAAVRAARTLRALPSSAPREALLPVRFRLR